MIQCCRVVVGVGVGSVEVDSSARSRSRSRSHQNLTDCDSGVGVNAAWLNVMHCTCRFCRKKSFCYLANVFSERSSRRRIPQRLLFNSACYFLTHICNAKPCNAQRIVSGKIKTSLLYELLYHDMDFNRTARSQSRSSSRSRVGV